MIGDTLTITFDTVAKVANKINQDNYSSEYLYRSATEQFQIRIRHQNENVKPGQRQFERHQVDVTRTVFDSVNGDEVSQVYTVIRLQKGTDPDNAEKLVAALCATMSASFIDKIVGWQS